MSIQFPISQNSPSLHGKTILFRGDAPAAKDAGVSPRKKRPPSALRSWLKKHDKTITRVLQLTGTVGAFYLASEAMIFPWTRGPAMSENNRWGENVVSVGSSSQRHASFDSNFTHALIKQLQKDDVQDISQAFRILKEKGYRSIFGLQQYAKISETNTNRMNNCKVKTSIVWRGNGG